MFLYSSLLLLSTYAFGYNDQVWDISEFDPDQECFEEFWSGNKEEWEVCCMGKASDSINCAPLRLEDPCYDSIVIGITTEDMLDDWNHCCDVQCYELAGYCDTYYCTIRTIYYSNRWWSGFIYWTLFSLLFLGSIVALCCLVCGGVKKKGPLPPTPVRPGPKMMVHIVEPTAQQPYVHPKQHYNDGYAAGFHQAQRAAAVSPDLTTDQPYVPAAAPVPGSPAATPEYPNPQVNMHNMQ